jgi:predicted hydrolase (HD superfamily)
MRHFASLYQEVIEKWVIIGLIHDLDFIIKETVIVKKSVAGSIGLAGE